MIALVQRVAEASVDIDGNVESEIKRGLLILVGVHKEDSDREIDWVARKCANLRVFPDENGVMNLSLIDVGAEALVVSQFTLYGQVGKGNRPSYNSAAGGDGARERFDNFVTRLESLLGKTVGTGVFGAMMEVRLVNDGPVTIWVEKAPASPGQISSAPS